MAFSSFQNIICKRAIVNIRKWPYLLLDFKSYRKESAFIFLFEAQGQIYGHFLF